MVTRRAFVSSGLALAAVPLRASVPQTITDASSSSSATAPGLHATMQDILVGHLADRTSKKRQGVSSPGELATSLHLFMEHMQASGVTGKINRAIQEKGGFAAARGVGPAFGDVHLKATYNYLAGRGVRLSASDKAVTRSLLNRSAYDEPFGKFVDMHGLTAATKGIYHLAHPHARQRIELARKLKATPDPSAPKFLIAPLDDMMEEDGDSDGNWGNDLMQAMDAGGGDFGTVTTEVTVTADVTDEITVYADPSSTDYNPLYPSLNVVLLSDNTQQIHVNLCKLVNGLSSFGLSQILSVLRANPELLEEVAFWLGCAPEAVLIMGTLLAISLIALAATC